MGLTEICTLLEETSYPLMKTLMTGLSLAPKAELILVYASAQLHDAIVCMLSVLIWDVPTLKYPNWIWVLVVAKKFILTLDHTAGV